MATLGRILSIAFAVGAASLRRHSAAAQTNQSAEASALWDAYVQRVTSEYSSVSGLQPGCKPQFHKRTTRSYFGSIMLFHGFTACPQQFERIVPLLTSKGYDVFLPLNPGHGYKWKSGKEVEDYIGNIPTSQSTYEEFVEDMDKVMKATSKQKVLMGMSLGGALAAQVGDKGGYDRQLLAAPMVRAKGLLDIIMTAARLSPRLNRKRRSWGEGCENERSKGRAGICQFTASIGATARNYGQSALTRADPAPSGSVEFIFVDDDQAVSTTAVQNLALKYGIDRNSRDICGMDAVVGHSFLSPYDNPDEDKFWLKEVTQKIADYLTKGTRLQQDGKIGDWPRCELRSR